MPRGLALGDEAEHRLVHHLAGHREGLLVGVGAGEHLAGADGVAGRLVGLYLADGAGLEAVRVVDEVPGVDAELPEERGVVYRGHAGEVEGAKPGEAGGDAGAYLPDVGDGAVVPYPAAEALPVQDGHVTGLVLGQDVERHLGEEEVGSHAGRGADAGLGPDDVHEHGGKPPGREAVEREVGARIDEALVDRVDVDVLLGNEPEVDAVDLGRHLHIAAHARPHRPIADLRRELEEARPARDAQPLDGRREGEADGAVATAGVCHHEVGGERVDAEVRALHRRIEALEVYAEIGAFTWAYAYRVRGAFPLAGPSHRSPPLVSNRCS